MLSTRFYFLATTIVQQGLRIVSILILARYVAKQDVGDYLAFMAVVGMFSAFGDFGMARALQQTRNNPTREADDSALVVFMAIAAAYSAGSVITGAAFWWHKGDHRFMIVGVLQALNWLLSYFYTYLMTLLNRQMLFGKETVQNLVSSATMVLAGIGAALMGLGIYTMALQPVIGYAVALLVLLPVQSAKVPKRWNWFEAKVLLRYGFKAITAYFTNNVQAPAINLVVYYAAGNATLGAFGRAVQVRDMVGYSVISAFDNLMFPIMMSRRDNPHALRETFLRTASMSLCVGAFGLAGLMSAAPELIRIFLGANWAEVPLQLRIVSALLLTSPLYLASSILSHALSRPLMSVPYSAATLALLAITVGPAVYFKFPLPWVLSMTMACQAVGQIGFWLKAGREVELSPCQMLSRVLPIAAAGVLAAGAGLGVSVLLPTTGPPGWPIVAWQGARVIAEGITCTAVFGGYVIAFYRDLAKQIYTLVRR